MLQYTTGGEVIKLEDLFIQLGYTNDEYILIRNSYNLIKMCDEILLRNVAKIINGC